jgi:hypothetical protein
MKMTLIPQASAAALLLVLTLCLQCAGVAALVEWLRGVTTKGGQGFGPVRSAVLVVKYPSVGEFLPVAMFSFVGTLFLFLLE